MRGLFDDILVEEESQTEEQASGGLFDDIVIPKESQPSMKSGLFDDIVETQTAPIEQSLVKDTALNILNANKEPQDSVWGGVKEIGKMALHDVGQVFVGIPSYVPALAIGGVNAVAALPKMLYEKKRQAEAELEQIYAEKPHLKPKIRVFDIETSFDEKKKESTKAIPSKEKKPSLFERRKSQISSEIAKASEVETNLIDKEIQRSLTKSEVKNKKKADKTLLDHSLSFLKSYESGVVDNLRYTHKAIGQFGKDYGFQLAELFGTANEEYLRDAYDMLQVDNPTIIDELAHTFGIQSPGMLAGLSIAMISRVSPVLSYAIGSTVDATSEAFVNTGILVETLEEKGTAPEKIKELSMQRFIQDIIINSIANKMGMFGGGKSQMGRAVIAENVEEKLQQVADNLTLGNPLFDENIFMEDIKTLILTTLSVGVVQGAHIQAQRKQAQERMKERKNEMELLTKQKEFKEAMEEDLSKGLEQYLPDFKKGKSIEYFGEEGQKKAQEDYQRKMDIYKQELMEQGATEEQADKMARETLDFEIGKPPPAPIKEEAQGERVKQTEKIDRSTIDEVFRHSKKIEEDDTGYTITLKNNKKVRIEIADTAEFDEEAFINQLVGMGLSYENMSEDERNTARRQIAGATKILDSQGKELINADALITLAKETADKGTVYHEFFHVIDELGLISATQKRSLMRKYNHDVEQIAEAYAKYEIGSKPGSLFEKIAQFFKKLRQTMIPSMRVFRQIQEGKFKEARYHQEQPKTRYMYAGKQAEGFDTAKRKFSNLTDKKERFEIDDSGAEIKQLYKGDISTRKKLSDILVHEKLYENYPWLKDLKVFMNPGMGELGAWYLQHPFYGEPTIEMNPDLYDFDSRDPEMLKQMAKNFERFLEENPNGNEYNPPEYVRQKIQDYYDLAGSRTKKEYQRKYKKTLLHEIQHAIQDKEGFAKGASPDQYQDYHEMYDFWESQYFALKEAAKLRIKHKSLSRNDFASKLTDLYMSNVIGRATVDFAMIKEDETFNNAWKEAEERIEEFRELTKKEGSAFEQYLRSAGEVEARDTSARQNLTEEERARTMPLESQEIPLKDMNVRYQIKDSDLIAEAKKYKSAEEFVASKVEWTGKQIVKEVENLGTDQGLSDFLKDKIAKEDYKMEKVSIDALRKSDLDLDDYLKSGEIREFDGEPFGMSPVVSSKGEVLDGYNRIAQTIANGDTEIEVLKGIDKQQLTDIWNKAQGGESLEQEAKKYKSAEEFVESQTTDITNTEKYTIKNGMLTIKTGALNKTQWGKVSSIAKKHGYDIRGSEDAKNLYENKKIEKTMAKEVLEKVFSENVSNNISNIDSENNLLDKKTIEKLKNSTVKDSQGRPMVLYHRTYSDFNKFNPKVHKQHGSKYGKGIYLSESPESAFGNITKKVYLNKSVDDRPASLKKRGWWLIKDESEIVYDMPKYTKQQLIDIWNKANAEQQSKPQYQIKIPEEELKKIQKKQKEERKLRAKLNFNHFAHRVTKYGKTVFRVIQNAGGIDPEKAKNYGWSLKDMREFGIPSAMVFKKGGLSPDVIASEIRSEYPHYFNDETFDAAQLYDFMISKERFLTPQEIDDQISEEQLQLDLDFEKEILSERAKIAIELQEVREERIDDVKKAVYNYAKRIGLRGYAYNQVDTMIKNAKTANNLQKAVDKMDSILEKKTRRMLLRKVKKEIARQQKRLKGIVGKRKNIVNYEHNVLLKDYLDGLSTENSARIKEAQALISQIEERPSDELSDQDRQRITQILTNNINLMSASELKTVLDNIKSIYKNGRYIYEVDKEQKKQAFEDAVGLSLEEIGVDPVAIGVFDEKRMSTFRKLVKELKWNIIRPEVILEYLGGFQRGVFYENTFAKINQAENIKLQNIEEARNAVDKIHEGLNLAHANRHYYTVDFNGKKVKLTLNQLMAVYAHSQNDGNRAHLTSSILKESNMKGETNQEIAYAEGKINELVDILPDEYKEAIDKMIDYYDEVQYKRLNEVFRKVYGIDLPYEARYFPIMKLDRINAENDVMIDLLQRYSSRLLGIQNDFAKKRTGSIASFKNLKYFETIHQNIPAVEHYIAFQEALQDVKKFLGDSRIKDAIQTKTQKEFYKDKGQRNFVIEQLDDYINRVAYGKMQRPGLNKGVINKAFRFLRKNYVVQVLGYNVVTMLKQPASFSQGLARVKKAYALRAVGEFLLHPFEVHAFVTEQSTMMRNRKHQMEREFAEMFEKTNLKGVMNISDKLTNFKQSSMAGIKTADMITTNILWYAKFMEVYNSTKSEQKAIDDADHLIRRTQPMGGLIHLPAIYMGTEFERALTMFTNQLNNNFNLQWEMKKTWAKKSGIKNAHDMAFYIAVPSLIIYLASHGFRWRDLKDDPEGVATQVVMNTIGGIPGLNIVGQVALNSLGNVVRKMRGRKPQNIFSSTIAPAQFIEIITSVIKKPNIKNTVNATGLLVGLPTSAPSRAIKGFKKAIEAAKKGNYIEAFRRVIWSDYMLQDKSLEHDMESRLHSNRSNEIIQVYKWYEGLDGKGKKNFKEYVKQSDRFKEHNEKLKKKGKKEETLQEYINRPKEYLQNKLYQFTSESISPEKTEEIMQILRGFNLSKPEAQKMLRKTYITKAQKSKRKRVDVRKISERLMRLSQRWN